MYLFSYIYKSTINNKMCKKRGYGDNGDNGDEINDLKIRGFM